KIASGFLTSCQLFVVGPTLRNDAKLRLNTETSLLVMIGLVSQDGTTSVTLLDGKWADPLMRKRHLGKEKLAICPGINFIRKTIRAPDHKDQLLQSCVHLFL